MSLAAALLLAGCADAALNLEGLQDGVVDEYMRLDIYPSEFNPDLLPESHLVDGWWFDGGDLVLPMSTPVQIAGVISGSGWEHAEDQDADRDLPVQSRVSAWVDGAIQGATTASDALTGQFALNLPPASGYAVSVVPADGSGLPFQVLTDQDLSADTDSWDVRLTDGVRLHGVVLDAEGAPVDGMTVRPVHSSTGVAGSAVGTDETGAWSLRVAPGEYALTFTPPEGTLAPTTVLAVAGDDGDDVGLDLVQGPIQPVTASGRVMDAVTHRPVGDTALRFRSSALPQHPDASLEVQATTDADGAWSATLLPGTWQATVVPPAERSLTPARAQFNLAADTDTSDRGILWLQPCLAVEAVVRDPAGQPAAGVVVVASEDDISGRTFTATTDAAGVLSMTVPAADLHLVLTPPDLAFAVTHLDVDGADFPAALSLDLGRLLTGRVEHDGAPVRDALVEVRDGHNERLWASTLTAEDGSFQLRLASDAAESAAPTDEEGEWDSAAVN
jgi:hypothetical protein